MKPAAVQAHNANHAHQEVPVLTGNSVNLAVQARSQMSKGPLFVGLAQEARRRSKAKTAVKTVLPADSRKKDNAKHVHEAKSQGLLVQLRARPARPI